MNSAVQPAPAPRLPEEFVPEFLFVACQSGAERALKSEMAWRWPDFRPAFLRPGFVTFKVPPEPRLSLDLVLGSWFARTYGISLGSVPGETLDQRAAALWTRLEGFRPQALHVWSRDAEPADLSQWPPPEVTTAREAILQHRPADVVLPDSDPADPLSPPAEHGDLVLDCVLVEPDQWWAGLHLARSGASRWPGGVRPEVLPPEAVSRAYLKMAEALRWSRLPMEPGDRVVELGSAPGGASQALLQRGLWVTGIDPAEMHPQVLQHPRFRHWRKRAKDVPRRQFREFRWLTADMNVAPNYVLDVVGELATRDDLHFDGLLLTLKLIDWKLADKIPEYLQRIGRWGFAEVRARQLQHNRQEICVAALRRANLRPRPPRTRPTDSPGNDHADGTD